MDASLANIQFVFVFVFVVFVFGSICSCGDTYRGSYMSAHVLLNL